MYKRQVQHFFFLRRVRLLDVFLEHSQDLVDDVGGVLEDCVVAGGLQIGLLLDHLDEEVEQVVAARPHVTLVEEHLRQRGKDVVKRLAPLRGVRQVGKHA